MSIFEDSEKKTHIYCGDAIDLYGQWESPTVIVCDGPYGINGYPGDLVSVDGLSEWYEKHVVEWNKYATPRTTLWFWNTEQGWATVHPMLVKMGWDFKACHIWNKGMSHVAGNTNTKTLSHLPVVSEVCVQYVKKPYFTVEDDKVLTMKEWLRYEWGRTGLPFSKTNTACGVVDAATRKYFTKCHLWYMPPAEQFGKIAEYANLHGQESGKPYFSIDGNKPLSKEEWDLLKPVFNCPFGMTNVWEVKQLRNKERLKINQKAIHLNQKPLELIKAIIEMSSNTNDVIWDPFAGLCTTAVASSMLGRASYCAEIRPEVFDIATKRLSDLQLELSLNGY